MDGGIPFAQCSLLQNPIPFNKISWNPIPSGERQKNPSAILIANPSPHFNLQDPHIIISYHHLILFNDCQDVRNILHLCNDLWYNLFV